MKYLIGLTGPSGSGKSTVSDTLRDLGVECIDCDAVAHSVLSSPEVMAEIEKTFSEEILSDKGMIDRKQLAEIVFSDPAQLEKLNEITHPAIIRRIMEKVDRSNSSYILVDAPTLFESKLNDHCNFVVSVIAEAEIRMERICERDGISEEKARLRVSAQPDEFFYTEKADLVLYNNRDLKSIERKTNHLFNYIVDITSPMGRDY